MLSRFMVIKLPHVANMNEFVISRAYTSYIENVISILLCNALNNYPHEHLDVLYNYKPISKSITEYVEEVTLHSEVDFSIFTDYSLTYLLEKEVEQIVEEYRMSNMKHSHLLNIKSMIVNISSLILSTELLRKGSYVF